MIVTHAIAASRTKMITERFNIIQEIALDNKTRTAL